MSFYSFQNSYCNYPCCSYDHFSYRKPTRRKRCLSHYSSSSSSEKYDQNCDELLKIISDQNSKLDSLFKHLTKSKSRKARRKKSYTFKLKKRCQNSEKISTKKKLRNQSLKEKSYDKKNNKNLDDISKENLSDNKSRKSSNNYKELLEKMEFLQIGFNELKNLTEEKWKQIENSEDVSLSQNVEENIKKSEENVAKTLNNIEQEIKKK